MTMTVDSLSSKEWVNHLTNVEPYNVLLKKQCDSNFKEIYISYAIYLARNGQIKEVFDIIHYITTKCDSFPTDDLYHIICNIVEYLRNTIQEKYQLAYQWDNYSCPICQGVLYQPITLNCGHTYCKRCLSKDISSKCKICKHHLKANSTSNVKVNVLVWKLVEKWWQPELDSYKLRTEGNTKYSERNLDEALDLYSKAINSGADGHLNYGNRSYILYCISRPSDSLEDAQKAIQYCPQWAKGHFRRAKSLISLNQYLEGLASYLICAVLEDPMFLKSIMDELFQTLKTYLSVLSSQQQQQQHDNFASSQVDKYSKLKQPKNSSNSKNSYYTKQAANKITSSISPSQIESFLQSNYNSEILLPLNYHIANIVNQETNVFKIMLDEFHKGIDEVKSTISKSNRNVDLNSVDKNDFECSLCFRCMYEPVTTPCGHSFCRSCLVRSLDHSPCCPLCKDSLKDYLAERKFCVNKFLEVAMQSFLPNEYNQSREYQLQDLFELAQAGKDSNHDMPIFVTTLALPSIVCPLHVFEPRYRLMIRRCMEAGTREFGMCMPQNTAENGYSDHGTILEIRDIEYTPDGRAIINTVGSRRFKCINKGVKDGYNTAKIEYLKDELIPSDKLEEFQLVHDATRNRTISWFSSLESAQRSRIIYIHGSIPEIEKEYWLLPNGPSWLWWTVAVLPIGSKIQAKIMQNTQLVKRLALVLKIIDHIENINIPAHTQ